MGRAFLKASGLVLLGLLMLVASAWGVLALVYWGHANAALRYALATAYGGVSLLLIAGLLWRQWRWRALCVFAVLFALLAGSWGSIAPSNHRDWQSDVAVLAHATIDGNRITIHNIRNFEYRTPTDYTPRYYDHTFDLRELSSVDLFTAHWMGPVIAHVFLSFGFTDGTHVVMSIEIRRERGERWSAIAGFFRNYEVYYAVADERDLVRLRTHVRYDPPEEVYLYRLRGSLASGQLLFLDYLRKLNELTVRPKWYNTLTTNCATLVWLHSRVLPGRLPFSWKIVVGGLLPLYLYQQGLLDTSLPFEELQRRAKINALAQAADQAPDFSQRIRAGLPAP
jgi:hypothetical protein